MIKNWNFHNLYMDYSSMYKGDNHPSDIDMFYLGRDNTLILGEIKNERGTLKQGQKELFKKLADGWRFNVIFLFIVHNKYVQKGDTKVNVPECYVREYYYKGRWIKPRRPLKVKDVIERYKL